MSSCRFFLQFSFDFAWNAVVFLSNAIGFVAMSYWSLIEFWWFPFDFIWNAPDFLSNAIGFLLISQQSLNDFLKFHLISDRMLLISYVISIWFRMKCCCWLIECYGFPSDFLAISYRFSANIISIWFRIEYHWFRMECYWFHSVCLDFLSMFCNFHLISYRVLLISCRMLLIS